MTFAVSLIDKPIGWIVFGAIMLWLFGSILVAAYGRELGYPWFPLFFVGLFLGFPIVLLAVVIGAGPHPDEP